VAPYLLHRNRVAKKNLLVLLKHKTNWKGVRFSARDLGSLWGRDALVRFLHPVVSAERARGGLINSLANALRPVDSLLFAIALRYRT
jgi:hypothetical protein